MKQLQLLLAGSSLFLAVVAQGELSKTYPTSPVTTLRLEAYLDTIQSSYANNYEVKTSTWDVLGSSYTYIPPNQTIQGFVWDVAKNTSTASSWSIDQYNKLMADEMKQRIYNSILDQQEIYMVWPDTNPVSGWRGWCLGTISGKKIPVACP